MSIWLSRVSNVFNICPSCFSTNIPLADKDDEKEEDSQHVAEVNDSANRFGYLAWCIILAVDDEMMKMMPRIKKSLKNRV